MKGDAHGRAAIGAALHRIETALAANCWGEGDCCHSPPLRTRSAGFEAKIQSVGMIADDLTARPAEAVRGEGCAPGAGVGLVDHELAPRTSLEAAK